MSKNSIGEYLAYLRRAKGITQQELADILNVSNKTISRWERDDSTPDVSLIPVIADIFGVSCDEILRGHDSKNKICEQTEFETKNSNKGDQLINKVTSRFKIVCIITAGLTLCALTILLILSVLQISTHDTLFIILLVLHILLSLASIIWVSSAYVHARSSLLSENINSSIIIKHLKILFIYFSLVILFNSISFFINFMTRLISVLLLGLIFISFISYIKSIKKIIPLLNYQDSAIVQKRYVLKVKSLFGICILTLVHILVQYIIGSMSVTYFTKGYKCNSVDEFITLMERKPFSDNVAYVDSVVFAGISIPSLNIKPKDEVSISQTKKISVNNQDVNWANSSISTVRTNEMIVYYRNDMANGLKTALNIKATLFFIYVSIFSGVIALYFILRTVKSKSIHSENP